MDNELSVKTISSVTISVILSFALHSCKTPNKCLIILEIYFVISNYLHHNDILKVFLSTASYSCIVPQYSYFCL